MARIRLTQRMKKAESQADGLFPGDVGNEERSKNYHDMDEYSTFEQTVNHELPDMRHEWKEEKRDENNIPVPKVAALYAAAQNAIKLSMMFLGDNAPQKMIEAQAKDFMKLGNSRLVASMNRWIETEDEEKVEEEAPKAEEEKPVEADDETEAPDEAPAAVEAPVEQPAPAVAEEEAPAVAEEPAAPVAEEAPAVADEEVMEEPAPEAPVADEEEIKIEDEGAQDLNTEVDFSKADDATEEVEPDKNLEALFADEEVEDDQKEVVAKTASKKQGIKKIAGQPKLVRVASKKVDELEGIWSKLDRPVID